MKKYQLSENYIIQQIGTDTVLLPCGLDKEVDLTKMIVLNESGAFIIGCIEQNALGMAEIETQMQSNFEELPTEYLQDLKDFIEEMSAQGILQVKEV